MNIDVILSILKYYPITTQILSSRLSKKYYDIFNINTKKTKFQTICGKIYYDKPVRFFLRHLDKLDWDNISGNKSPNITEKIVPIGPNSF